jgi:hypothetical protein
MALEILSADVKRLCVGEEENPWSRAITENVVLVHHPLVFKGPETFATDELKSYPQPLFKYPT